MFPLLLRSRPPLQCTDCNLPNCNAERHKAPIPFVYPVCSDCGIELLDLIELYEKPALRNIHSCEICSKRYGPDEDLYDHFNLHFSKQSARTTATTDVMHCISCYFNKETLKKDLPYVVSKPIAKLTSEKPRYVPKSLQCLQPMLDARVLLTRLPDSQIPSTTRNVKNELADETDFLVFSHPLSPSFGHTTEDTKDDTFNIFLDATSSSSEHTLAPRKRSSNPFVETTRIPNVDGRFGCSLCEYSALIRRNLMNHERVNHNINNESKLPIGCPKCPRRFEERGHQRRHQSRFHKEELADKADLLVFSSALSPSFADTEDTNDVKNFNSFSDDFYGSSTDQTPAKQKTSSIPFVETTRIANVDGRFCCSLCEYSAALRRNLMHHERVKHNINNESKLPVGCPKCPRRFEERRHQRRHQSRFHKEGLADKTDLLVFSSALSPSLAYTEDTNDVKNFHSLSEALCGSTTDQTPAPQKTSSNPFVETTRTANVDGKFGCSLCEYSAAVRRNLMHHERVKHNINNESKLPVGCPKCPRRFEENRHLKRHESRIHRGFHKVIGRKNLKCRACDLPPFANDKKREEHENCIHLNAETNRWSCRSCPMSFFKPAELRTHEFGHTGIRPYICEKCGFSTKRKEHIERHLFTHTDDRPFICDLCPEKKSFKSINRLKYHIRCFHQRKYKYPCDQCDRVFSYQSDRRRHLRSHGGVEKKFGCVLCEKRFYEPKDLRLHMKSH